MKKYFILLFLSLTFLILIEACSSKRKYNTNLENPIILVSGYGSKMTVWENTGFVNYLGSQGLIYGGKLLIDNKKTKRIRPESELSGKIDVFSLAYSDSTSNVSDLALELKSAIKYVKRYTKAKKVMLIGYSMGGVVCREYLVNNNKRHNVQTLVTIASPHKGSLLADIANTTYGLFKEKAVGYYLDYISSEMGIDIKGEALDNLSKEGHNEFLQKLNNSPHPLDINYISIIGVNELATTVNPRLSKLGIKIYDGDLVCSRDSQNMINIFWFKNNHPKILDSYEITGVHHLNILNNYQEIYSKLTEFIIPTIVK